MLWKWYVFIFVLITYGIDQQFSLKYVIKITYIWFVLVDCNTKEKEDIKCWCKSVNLVFKMKQ